VEGVQEAQRGAVSSLWGEERLRGARAHSPARGCCAAGWERDAITFRDDRAWGSKGPKFASDVRQTQLVVGGWP